MKLLKRIIATMMIVALGATSGGSGTVNINAATNGIVKGPDVVDEEDSFTTKLSTQESVTVKIVNSVLTVKVAATEYVFKIGNITKAADAAVVNEKDGLLHVLTLGGVYYVFDLYTGVQIVAYRNSINGKYCSSRNSYAYMVYGKALINSSYFYELLTSNSVSRELLMTRREFDIIINGGDPSLDEIETPTPTPTPTKEPTPTPTVIPTKEPTIEFNFEFWWQSYLKGTITWEQFTEIMWKYQWTATTEKTEKSVTYYFYDEEGRLIRTETTTTGTSTETGTGTGTATEDNKGKAEIDIKEEGEGGGSGTVVINTPEPTIEPTLEPTPIPTPTPTKEPTPTTTPKPTVEPTKQPTPETTVEPTKEPTIEFNFEFWWNKYLEGTITWEQLTEVMWKYQWTVTTEKTEKSVTYYFYDEEGRLSRTETITTGSGKENGSGTGSATAESNATAEAKVIETGNGGGAGTIIINVPTPATISTIVAPTTKPTIKVSKTIIVLKPGQSKTLSYSAKDSSGATVKATVTNPSSIAKGKVTSKTKLKITASAKATNCSYTVITVKNGAVKKEITVIISKTTKDHARVVTSGTRIKLYKKSNQLYGWLIFNKKKGTLNWNGYTLKGVKTCGFNKSTWNVIAVMKNGAVYKLPRTQSSKTLHKVKIAASESAINLNRDAYGFVGAIKLKCGGVQSTAGL